jgi:hypothetical protein
MPERTLRLLIAALIGFCQPVLATVVIPAGFSELVSEAGTIVHGRVVDVRSDWAPGRRRIETFVTVEAEDYLKGQLGEHVIFRVAGGRLGRYRSVLVGAPSFAEGDEVILFLTGRGPSVPSIMGLNQGVFRVAADDSGQKRVIPPPLIAEGVEPVRLLRGDPSRRSSSLIEFEERVRQVLRAGRSPQ